MGATKLTIQPRVANLLSGTLVWDNHGCMPLRPDDEAFLPQLARYHAAGVDVVTLNVAFDAMPWENTVPMLTLFRSWVSARPDDYLLIETVEDINVAKATGRLGVMFDIEGGSALNGELRRVQEYYRLGVRWMLIAYNRNNALGGGCQDEDSGLTPFGRQVIAEMERVGMVVCCTHTGARTTMQVMEHAKNPVIFSHSNPLGVWRHRRNIRDEAIKACAATGGVVGINGVGIFLGRNDSRSETIAHHIDYVVSLVGPEHVGLGLDYVFDMQELIDYVAANPQTFPAAEYGTDPPAFAAPEQVPEIAAELLRLGYDDAALRAILGENYLRVARAVWH